MRYASWHAPEALRGKPCVLAILLPTLWHYFESEANKTVAYRYESMRLYPSRELIFIVRGTQWPFPLVVQVLDTAAHIHLRATSLSRRIYFHGCLLRLIRHRQTSLLRISIACLSQGASVVRFANPFIDAYSADKNFTLVAVFIRANGIADRYLLFQSHSPSSTSTDKVCVLPCISKL